MPKLLLLLGLAFLTFSQPASAETYSCAGSLERYSGRSGYEQAIFIRNGKQFIKKSEFGETRLDIVEESDEDIVLIGLGSLKKGKSIYVAMLDKRHKQYIEHLYSVRDGQTPQRILPMWGTCLVTK